MSALPPPAPRSEPPETLPVLADVRALPARESPPGELAPVPRAPAAAVAAGGFLAGAAVAALARRGRARRAARRRRRQGAAQVVQVLATRSFMIDVHLLGRQ